MKRVWRLDKNGTLLFGECKASWKLTLNQNSEIRPDGMAHFKSSRKDGALTCKWTGNGAYPALEVSVEWRLRNGAAEGRISFTGLRGKDGVEKIHFPVVELPGDGECQLVVPQEFGSLIQNAGKKVFDNPKCESKTYWSHLHTGQMQFCAYIHGKKGLYFDTRDSRHHSKEYGFFKGDGGKRLCEGVYPLPLSPKTMRSRALPYAVSVKPFKGGWYEASQIYREWALTQRWAAGSRMRRSLDGIAAWVWNRGDSSEAIPPVERLREDLGLPVALDWYWWHRNPYDTEYPRYLPPRDGTAQFKNVLRRLKRQGILSQVYVNGMLRDMDDKSWKDGGLESVIVNKDGTERAKAFNIFMKHRLAFVCGESEGFREKIVGIAKALRSYGLDSLYLDVIGMASGMTCHNPRHKHAPGGGDYQVKGFREMFKQVRKACPGMLLSTESCPEAYMDIIESGIVLAPSEDRFNWSDGSRESIPLFNAVYHGLFTLFGSYASIDGVPPYDPLWPKEGKWRKELEWHKLCPDQFPLEISRCVTWGMQPTLVNLRMSQIERPDLREYYEFFVNAARFYHAHRDALLRGRMLAPGELAVKSAKVKILQRFVFTKEGEHKIVVRESPGMLHSRWETPDGRRLLILANFGRKKLDCRWSGDGDAIDATVEARSFKAIEMA